MTDYRWELASGGRIPDGAIPHGYDDNGEPLWVCRARVHGGVHPGKVRPGFGAAAIATGGEELGVLGDYEVLMDRGVWGIASGGRVPDDAYPAGHEHNGDTLYVARAAVHANNLQLGKVRRDFGAAHIGYGNREVMLHAYEVLLRPTVPVVSAVRKMPPDKASMGRAESGRAESVRAESGRVELEPMVPQSFTPAVPALGSPLMPYEPGTPMEPHVLGALQPAIEAAVSPAVVDGNRVTVTVTIDLGGR